MELTDYNITFVHIKGKNNVLADAISRLKKLNIYKEPLENPKTPVVSNTQENVLEICATDMHTMGNTMLHTEQRWDIMYRKLASQLCHGNKSKTTKYFKPSLVALSPIKIRNYRANPATNTLNYKAAYITCQQ